jgi:hypothetical protein
MKKTTYLLTGLFALILLSSATNPTLRLTPAKAIPALTPLMDGVLSTTISQTLQNNALSPFYDYSVAMFQDNSGGTQGNSSNVDSVVIDLVRLKYSNPLFLDTTFHTPQVPATWRVYGHDVFPSFVFTNTYGTPVYTGYGSLPTVLDHTQPSAISISGFSNADKVEITIQNTSNSQKVTSVMQNSVVNFSSADLSSVFSSGGTVTLTVMLSRFNFQTLVGKKYNFVTQYQIVKNITLN